MVLMVQKCSTGSSFYPSLLLSALWLQGLEGFILVLQGGLNTRKMKPVQEVYVHPAAVQQLIKA